MTDLCKLYKAALYLNGLSSSTTESYLRHFDKLTEYLDIAAPEFEPKNVKVKNLKEFIVWRNEVSPMSPGTQDFPITGLRSFFKFCMTENLIKRDPSRHLHRPKKYRGLPNVLTDTEMQKVLTKIPKDNQFLRNRALLQTMYSSGLRLSETTGLLLSKVQLDKGQITVIGKGDKERLIPIGQRAILFIREYLEVRPVPQNGHEDYVFLGNRGYKLTRGDVFEIIKQLTTNANIKRSVSPHTFSHTCATHMVQNGADLPAVQKILGHSSIMSTQVYTHLNTKYLHETVNQFHPAFKK